MQSKSSEAILTHRHRHCKESPPCSGTVHRPWKEAHPSVQTKLLLGIQIPEPSKGHKARNSAVLTQGVPLVLPDGLRDVESEVPWDGG